MKNKPKIFVCTAVTLCVCEALLMLFSWVVSVLFPSLPVNSLLGERGLRFLLSGYAGNASAAFFFYVMFASVCIGVFVKSGMPAKIASFKTCGYNERLAVTVFFVSIAAALVFCLFLAFLPHSLLLGLDGKILSSTFLKAVLLVFGIVLAAAGSILLFLGGNTCKDAVEAFSCGFKAMAPFVVLLFLAGRFLASLLFVFYAYR